MCVHITHYVASDPCFRSASGFVGSYNVIMCDIYLLSVQLQSMFQLWCSMLSSARYQVLRVVLFSHHTSLQPFTGGTSYCTVGKSLKGQEGSVCDISRALGPVLECRGPGSTSGQYQHFWVHCFLDFL